MKSLTWQRDLLAYLTEQLTTPFKWGVMDCALFAAGAAVAQGCADPARLYRGTYKSEIGAKRALTATHGSLQAAFDATFAQVNPEFMQRGDIVLFIGDQGETCGIYWGGAIYAMTKQGCTRTPPKGIINVWRVA